MKLELVSILTCHSCKRQEQEKMLFNLGDDAERMAKVVEEKLVRKHTDGNLDCMSNLAISTTSRIVNMETNQVVRPVESGLDIEGMEDSGSITEDPSEFLGEPVSPIGYVHDF